MGKEMGVRISNQRHSIQFGQRNRLLIEVDPGRIKMAIFDGIKELQVFQKISIERPRVGEIGVRSNNQSIWTAKAERDEKSEIFLPWEGLKGEHGGVGH